MIREIIFRGKRIDTGKFITGDLLTGQGEKSGKRFIFPQTEIMPKGCHPLDGFEIQPESLGEFTGLLDKQGNKIFEGDILSFGRSHYYFVSFGDGLFLLYHFNGLKEIDGGPLRWGPLIRVSEHGLECEIIGNIHDNPELIGKEAQNV